MYILAIETSCDDTGVALLEIKKENKSAFPAVNVCANIVSSQTEIHRHWGGVVPNLAKRAHIENLPKIFKTLLAKPYWLNPDLVAVTVGPGLEPALWAGIEFAKKIGDELKIPVVGVNHLEGHLYSFLLSKNVSGPASDDSAVHFPAIALLVSGGHTSLLLMKDLHHWKTLGETRDDAVGEAFDKVARMLGLPYPGGPEIEKLAAAGNSKAIDFPRPMAHTKDYDFSFSGLKTAVLYYLRDHKAGADVAASFQAAAIDVLVKKAERAVEEYGAKAVMLCGGVAANRALRAALQKTADERSIKFIAPAAEYNTDNAAMIGVAAYMKKMRRCKALSLEANGTLEL